MERARRVLLIAAIVFPAAHLFLWTILATVTAWDLVAVRLTAERVPPLLLTLGLGVLGGVAVALPVRSLGRPGPWLGAVLIGCGLLYAVLAAVGLPQTWSAHSPVPALLSGLGGWVTVVPMAFAGAFGSLYAVPALIAATYALSLVLGGLLTLRAARGVDAGTARR